MSGAVDTARCSYCERPAQHSAPILGIAACDAHDTDACDAVTAWVRLSTRWLERAQLRQRAERERAERDVRGA